MVRVIGNGNLCNKGEKPRQVRQSHESHTIFFQLFSDFGRKYIQTSKVKFFNALIYNSNRHKFYVFFCASKALNKQLRSSSICNVSFDKDVALQSRNLQLPLFIYIIIKSLIQRCSIMQLRYAFRLVIFTVNFHVQNALEARPENSIISLNSFASKNMLT